MRYLGPMFSGTPQPNRPLKRRLFSAVPAWLRGESLIATIVAVIVAFNVPYRWCARGYDAWLEPGGERSVELARGVESLLQTGDLEHACFGTGSELFDGEWLFGSNMMASVGYSQLALARPDLAAWCETRSRACIARLQSPEVRAFDARSWRGEDPLESLAGAHGHAAYLGYFNLVLGLHRKAFGDDEGGIAALNDRISMALVRRMDASPMGLLETYPGEAYPVDNCYVAGSIGLHQAVTGIDHSATIERWVKNVRSRAVHAETGLLIQAVDAVTLGAYDEPRGSGTVLGLLGVRYADESLARELYEAVSQQLSGRWLGFGAVREYPVGVAGGGDIDSGPIVFGYGMSATGFCLGAARAAGDAPFFRRLYATAHLCGAPVSRGVGEHFISGGNLGNAIFFAMLTTPPFSEGAGEGDE
jgi:hypothetical protein